MDRSAEQGKEFPDLREAQGDEYQDLMVEQGEEYQDRMVVQGDQYRDQVIAQGDEYQAIRERQGREYEDTLTGSYSDAKEEWRASREQAIQGAEGRLKSIYENYSQTFKGTLAMRWAAMIGIMVFLLALIIFFQKRKDMV